MTTVTTYILVSGIFLGIILFPLWCAIIMKLFCKSFSDEFITRFLGGVCSIQIISSTVLQTTFTRHEDLGVDPEVRYLINGLILIILIAVYYFICKSIAKAGVGIVNRLNLNNASKRTAGTRSA